MSGVVIGTDGLPRCWWGAGSPEYVAYHDLEWGRAVTDDRRLFEKLCLEGFQAGLSWLTILRKREAFRAAFAGFEPALVATFGEEDVARLLGDAGIVRHEGKIRAAINNARRALELIDEAGSLAAWFWPHAPHETAAPTGSADLPATTQLATSLAKDLKRRGWMFVGPTTVYAFLQAMGLVNDHLAGCHARQACQSQRAAVLRMYRP